MSKIVTVWVCAAMMGLGGCDDGGGGGGSGGTVVEPWDTYCTLTFTEPYAVDDGFGDVEFTAPAGSSWLVSGTSFGAIQILFLTGGATVDFDVEIPDGDPPYTLSCDLDAVDTMYGVFSDLTLYADVELSAEACRLTAGTVADASGHSTGFGVADLENFDLLAESHVYEIVLGPFSERCGGRESAFARIDSARIGSTRHTAMPIRTILAPEAPADAEDSM